MSDFTGRCLRLIAVILLSGSTSVAFQTQDDESAFEYHAPDPRLEGLIRESLQSNPRLGQALAGYRAAIQKIPQVTALPDPMLSFTRFLRSPETRVGPQTGSLMLSQRFPWFGKLDLQGKVAVREASAAYESYRALERGIAAEVKHAFYELAYLDRAIAITLEDELLVEHFAQLAEDRYATGEGLQYGVIKIQAEITRVVNRLELLSQQRVSAEARLNTLRSRPPETSLAPVSMPSLPELPSPELDLEALYALGESNRPELDAALDEIEKQQLAGELARKDYWPDVTLSAGFVNVAGRRDPAGLAQPPPDNGKNVYSVSVGVNIPLRRDRYRAAELAAVERAAAGRDRYRSLVEEMRYEIRDAVNRLETLERQLDLYREALVPQAESALASAETAYETGLVGALELLDSERVLIDVRLAQARFAADYMQALSRLERALGTRFPNP